MGTPHRAFSYFLKRNDYSVFLFAFVDDETLPKMGLFLKKRICSFKSIFSFKS